MSTCPRCARPVAVQRDTCLYCGAPLGAAVAAAGAVPPAAAEPIAAPARLLVLVDPAGATIAALSEALAMIPFEAELLLRRGVPLTHRVLEVPAAAQEAARLRAVGLRVVLADEAIVRAALEPLTVRSGEPVGEHLRLDTGGSTQLVAATDLALIVRGPISREYAAAPGGRRQVRTATLEPGYRFHLHRRGTPQPLEIDPATFAFPPSAQPLSSFLTLTAWLGAFASVADDDSFRRETPALGLAAAGRDALALALGAGRRRERQDASAIVDNLRQFRWFSGVRAGFVRARHS